MCTSQVKHLTTGYETILAVAYEVCEQAPGENRKKSFGESERTSAFRTVLLCWCSSDLSEGNRGFLPSLSGVNQNVAECIACAEFIDVREI